jgi:hypothetical protein
MMIDPPLAGQLPVSQAIVVPGLSRLIPRWNHARPQARTSLDKTAPCRRPGYRVVFLDGPYWRPRGLSRVPARIVWTRVCNSGGLFHGGCLTGFMG